MFKYLMTISEIHQKLLKKELSVVELTKDYLGRIKREDKNINAFLTLTSELALKKAEEIQKKINKRERINLLTGIPCAVKDIILVENIRCTAGSKILGNYIAPYDATVIKRLKSLGVIFLGKTNMDEFAMGSSTENSAYFITKNPLDMSRVPGGSSGGSAAAVAADFCQFALGSDTGGSVRQPASFCGVVGLKPTYGSVSRHGLISMASSLDQIGPITKTIDDAQIVFDSIKGKDPLDSTSVELNLKCPSSAKTSADRQISNVKNLRIGIPREYFIKGIDGDVKGVIEKAIKKFKERGAEIKEISLPHTEYALASYYLIMPSEVSANLARFDGIKYGMSVASRQPAPLETAGFPSGSHVASLFEVYSKTRGNYFGKEAKRRIILGTFALSAGYYDEYYLKAQKVRTLIKNDFENVFKEVDLILTPVSPSPAFKIGEKTDDPIKMYLSDIFTVASSLAGVPAISVPCGYVSKKDSDGKEVRLPVGIQIIGPHFEEEKIFKAGKICEEIQNPK